MAGKLTADRSQIQSYLLSNALRLGEGAAPRGLRIYEDSDQVIRFVEPDIRRYPFAELSAERLFLTSPASSLIELVPLGQIRTGYTRLDQCPPSGRRNPDETVIEIFEHYAQGLQNIELASHIWVFCWLHKAVRDHLLRRPSSDGTPQRGVFASRSPFRPNPVALSVVRLIAREGNTLRVSGLECLDGTPLIDIKPYVPGEDRIEGATIGWTNPAGIVSA